MRNERGKKLNLLKIEIRIKWRKSEYKEKKSREEKEKSLTNKFRSSN